MARLMPTARTSVSNSPEALVLDVPTLRQPDDVSCGPTSLVKVLKSYGDERTFEHVEPLVRRNDDGGTLAVFLGIAAVELGYSATIYSYNLRVFDPTWSDLAPHALSEKLKARAATVTEVKLRTAVDAYVEFLQVGGEVRFDDLSNELLMSLLDAGRPIICGLSATYLYRIPREDPRTNAFDDIAGEPSGHFLVVCGYREHGRHFVVTDPYRGLPLTVTGTYEVEAQRLLNAIMLGDFSYDAVLLVISPRPNSE